MFNKLFLMTLCCSYISIANAIDYNTDPESCIPEKNYTVHDKAEVDTFMTKFKKGQVTLYLNRQADEEYIKQYPNNIAYSKNYCEGEHYCRYNSYYYKFIEYEMDTTSRKGVYTNTIKEVDNSVQTCEDGHTHEFHHCFTLTKNEDNKPHAEYLQYVQIQKDGTTIQRMDNAVTGKNVYIKSEQIYMKDGRIKTCEPVYKGGFNTEDDEGVPIMMQSGMFGS